MSRSSSQRWILALLLLTAVASWSLHHWLTVVRPDRSRVISDSAMYADLGRSLAREQQYVDRLVTPIQVRLFQVGPPHPATSWSPLFPMMLATAAGFTGGLTATLPTVVNALGFLIALVALYLLSRVVLGDRGAWIPPLAMALSPRLLDLACDGLTEGWFTAFLILAVLFLMTPGRRLASCALAGVLLAMAELTRVNAVCFLPVLALLATVPTGERAPAPADGAPGDGDPPRLPSGRAWVFVGLFVLTLVPWMLFRFEVFGSPFFELQRFNLLHNLGPWRGSDAFRSLFTPDPGAYILVHPFEYGGKILVGLAKLAFLVPLSYLQPLEFALIVIGAIAMLRRGGVQRRAMVVVLALAAVQSLVSSATLLDPRIWQPVGVLLWIPLAAGITALARRLSREWPEIALTALVLVALVLPFGSSCLSHQLRPDTGNARFTEEEISTLGAWVGILVPPDEAVLSDLEELVWYGDRMVVWRPFDPSEVPMLRALSGVRYVVWRSAPGSPGEQSWQRYFDEQLAGGALERLGELRTDSGRFMLGRWP
jgi:hypothetical protein